LNSAWLVFLDNGLAPLTALELYTLSLTSKEMREYYLRNVFRSCVFDVTEIVRRSAHSVLQALESHQVHIPSHLRSQNTTPPDWAAQIGDVEVLQWLLSHTSERCTPFAMDLAALNGHLPVLTWLHANEAGGGCTNLAATWGRRAEGTPPCSGGCTSTPPLAAATSRPCTPQAVATLRC
jgi:hypothetical protein